MFYTSRVLLLERQQAILDACTSINASVVKGELTIVEVLLDSLRDAARLSMMLLESIVIVATRIHRLLLDLC